MLARYQELLINPDNYARAAERFIPDLKARYVFAMNYCDELRDMLLESKADFGFETVLSTSGKIEFMKRAKDSGYVIDLIYVSLENPELCQKRVEERVKDGGHDVDKEKIRSRYFRSLGNLCKAVELADNAEVYDNSGKFPRLILVKKGGKFYACGVEERPGWVEKHLVSFISDAVLDMGEFKTSSGDDKTND